MGLWDKARNWVSGLGRKSKLFRSILRRVGVSPSFSINQWQDYAKDGYEKNPYVYSVIDNIQTSAASIPPRLFRITGGGRTESAMSGYERKGHSGHYGRHKKRRAALTVIRHRTQAIRERTGVSPALAKEWATKALVEDGELEIIEGHELIALLDRPNPWYQRSYGALIKSIVGGLELGGEVYLEPKMPSTSQTPRELYAHMPQSVTFQSGDRRQQPIDTIKISDQAFSYSPDPTESEIWYMKYWHPRNPLRGLSPVQAAAHSIDINNEGRGWNLSLLQNGAEISGIISFEESLNEESKERLKQQFEEEMEPGKIIRGEGTKFDFQELGMSPKDMQWGDLSNLSAKEVAITWNVPPEIAGFDESKTFSNYQTADRVYHNSKILPLMDFVFGELNSTLVPLFGDDLLLDYDTSNVEALQEEEDAFHERVREDAKTGLVSLESASEMLGYSREEGTFLIPSNMVPLSAVGTQQERALEMLPDEKSKLSPTTNGYSRHDS